MEQLEQLRVMRDEARMRIAATADYKLATSLDALIHDLETVLGIPHEDDGVVSPEAGPASTEDTVEAAEEPEEPVQPESLTPDAGADLVPSQAAELDEPATQEYPPAESEEDAGQPFEFATAPAESELAAEPEDEEAAAEQVAVEETAAEPELDEHELELSELSSLIHGSEPAGEPESEIETTLESELPDMGEFLSQTAEESSADGAVSDPASEEIDVEEDALMKAMEALDEDIANNLGADETGSPEKS